MLEVKICNMNFILMGEYWVTFSDAQRLLLALFSGFTLEDFGVPPGMSGIEYARPYFSTMQGKFLTCPNIA